MRPRGRLQLQIAPSTIDFLGRSPSGASAAGSAMPGRRDPRRRQAMRKARIGVIHTFQPCKSIPTSPRPRDRLVPASRLHHRHNVRRSGEARRRNGRVDEPTLTMNSTGEQGAARGQEAVRPSRQIRERSQGAFAQRAFARRINRRCRRLRVRAAAAAPRRSHRTPAPRGLRGGGGQPRVVVTEVDGVKMDRGRTSGGRET